MTDKVQRIREEIERLKEETSIGLTEHENGVEQGRMEIINAISLLLDSIKEEPVSEDLDSFAIKYAQDKPYPVTVCQAVKVGANWQKTKDQSIIELAEDHAMLAGMEKMKEEMMAKAVDAVVKIDAGGYPYVDRTIELYDYDKDIPLAKKGDKVKILVIREE